MNPRRSNLLRLQHTGRDRTMSWQNLPPVPEGAGLPVRLKTYGIGGNVDASRRTAVSLSRSFKRTNECLPPLKTAPRPRSPSLSYGQFQAIGSSQALESIHSIRVTPAQPAAPGQKRAFMDSRGSPLQKRYRPSTPTPMLVTLNINATHYICLPRSEQPHHFAATIHQHLAFT
jgi:hypothetical protein